MPLIAIYLIVGLCEYFRLSDEYRQKLYDDFPYHDKFYLEISLIVVSLIFSPTLLLIKMYLKTKQFLRNLWIKMTLPYRLFKFRRKMDKVNKEKDPKKSVEMLFDAMSEILR